MLYEVITEIAEACQHLPNILFPKYYSELSSERIITMDWMEGLHLSEFTAVNTDQEKANQIGQALWDVITSYSIHYTKLYEHFANASASFSLPQSGCKVVSGLKVAKSSLVRCNSTQKP